MKTQGAIEAAICEGISRFEQEYRGRGPKEVRAYLLGDFVVVRLQDLLTPAERRLAECPSKKGRDLLKQVRTHLIETAKPLIQALVHAITGVQVVSLHHDISTVTGEAFVVLTLAEPPSYRQAKSVEMRSATGAKEVREEASCNGHAYGELIVLPIDQSAGRAQQSAEG